MLCPQKLSGSSQYTVPCIHSWPPFNIRANLLSCQKGWCPLSMFGLGLWLQQGSCDPRPVFDFSVPSNSLSKTGGKGRSLFHSHSQALGREVTTRSWRPILDDWKERRNIRLASGQEGTRWRCAMKLSQMDSFSKCHFASEMKAALSLGLRKALLLSQEKKRN